MIGKTLTLSADWDLTLTAAGTLSTATGDYALSQNVANAVRLFTNDAFYDPERGIPHFITDLGQKLNPAVVRAEVQAAALAVDGVKEAALKDIRLLTAAGAVTGGEIAGARTLTGDLRIKTENGRAYVITI